MLSGQEFRLDVSVIIPAHNEAEELPRTLPALREALAGLGALAGRSEVIVVDDGSTDGTAEVAERHGAGRVVRVALRQISAVRNAGAAAARGELLVFVDADTVVPEATLRGAVRAVAGGAVGGGAPVRFEAAVPLGARVGLSLWNGLARTFRWAAGCFVFARREAFEQVGGFDERYYAAEEIVISERLKRRGPVAIVSRPVVTSSRKMTPERMSEYWRVLGKTIVTGGAVLRNREGLGLWYGRQRGQ